MSSWYVPSPLVFALLVAPPSNCLGAPFRLHLCSPHHTTRRLRTPSLQFGALTPLEPRLGKKLVEPLTALINTTPAKSLLYECVRTVVIGMAEHESIVRLAVSKLKEFVEDPDQNCECGRVGCAIGDARVCDLVHAVTRGCLSVDLATNSRTSTIR